MIVVLSPSKTLDFDNPPRIIPHTQPDMLKESAALIKLLRAYDKQGLMKLMSISEKLAVLNEARYKRFKTPFTPSNARQAILAFKGDVYEGIDVDSYDIRDFAYAQEHVRILSGLYGVLRPLDLIQPYRLEMGTKLPSPKGKDLYAYWGTKITTALNKALADDASKILVNLASGEYFEAVRPKSLKGKLLTLTFKEKRPDGLKIIGLMAKKARGLMTNFIVKQRVEVVSDLKEFHEGGYRFARDISDSKEYVFVR